MKLSLHEKMHDLPTFEHLPLVEGFPRGCTWGLWDTNGEKDELGTLNLLTTEVLKEASKELTDGVTVSLKSDVLRTRSSACLLIR